MGEAYEEGIVMRVMEAITDERILKLGFHRYGCGMRMRHPAKNGYSVNA